MAKTAQEKLDAKREKESLMYSTIYSLHCLH